MATGVKKRKRAPRAAVALRWLAVAALALIGVLYYKPVRTYLDTRAELAQRAAEVRALEQERETLERRLAATATAATLIRDARRLGFVEPGERLFIVKGISEWRRRQTERRAP